MLCQGIALPGVTEDADTTLLSDALLQALVLASLNVPSDYDPETRPHDWFNHILMKFVQDGDHDQPSKETIGQKSRPELLHLLEENRQRLQNAEVLLIPPVPWDGSSGEQEMKAIRHVGLLFEAYECQWRWYDTPCMDVCACFGPCTQSAQA